MMATADLDRLASLSGWIAMVALILSGIALALFFGGAGEFWGPVNDALIVVTAVALIPVVLAVGQAAGDRGQPWVLIVSIAALAGLVLMALGQTLLIVGRLSLDGSYVTGGIGVIPFIAWIVLVAVLALGLGVLPGRTGWLAVATLVTIGALSVVAAITLGPPTWVAGIALLAAMSALFADLALQLGSRAAASAVGAAA
jgi:hypothetical protein